MYHDKPMQDVFNFNFLIIRTFPLYLLNFAGVMVIVITID